jgi:DNA-binding CsgD family transcriptional regulator
MMQNAPPNLRNASLTVETSHSMAVPECNSLTQVCDAQFIRNMLSLTRMPAAVAILLAQGLSIDDIAIRLNRMPSTVRQHSKMIMKKIKVNRQSHLVAVVWHRCLVEHLRRRSAISSLIQIRKSTSHSKHAKTVFFNRRIERRGDTQTQYAAGVSGINDAVIP